MELNGNKTVIALTAVLVAVAVVAGLLIYTRSIHSSGIIKSIGIEIYQDEQLTTPLEAIDWGNVTQGSQYIYQCWIINTKNTVVTLSMQVKNWNPPEASTVLTIDWNYQDATILNPNQKIKITFYLTVSLNPEPITNFSNDIEITATEKEENN